jgi:hypothetical protein
MPPASYQFLRGPGQRIEDQRGGIGPVVEVEHVEYRPRQLIQRKRSERLPRRQCRPVDKAEVPVRFDKPKARGLVGHGVVEVGSGRVGMNESLAFVSLLSPPILGLPGSAVARLVELLTAGPSTWSYQSSESS